MSPRSFAASDPQLVDVISTETQIIVLFAGLLFLWALFLGALKWRGMRTPPDHVAHPYIDTAHRAALLYSFATFGLAMLVELSAWPTWVNVAAVVAIELFFVGAIASYQAHGMRRDTTNQFEGVDPVRDKFMVALIGGEIGGTVVLLAGVVATLVQS